MKIAYNKKDLWGLLQIVAKPADNYLSTLLDWFYDFRGSKLEYGINIPYTALVTQKPWPAHLSQVAPFVVFSSKDNLWSPCLVIDLKAKHTLAVDSLLYKALVPHGIDCIAMEHIAIELNYLYTREWRLVVKRAIYSPCASRFIYSPSKEKIVTLPKLDKHVNSKVAV
jgi:hypothetical protein